MADFYLVPRVTVYVIICAMPSLSIMKLKVKWMWHIWTLEQTFGHSWIMILWSMFLNIRNMLLQFLYRIITLLNFVNYTKLIYKWRDVKRKKGGSVWNCGDWERDGTGICKHVTCMFAKWSEHMPHFIWILLNLVKLY